MAKATPQSVDDPTEYKNYKPEKAGSGIRVDGKPVKDEPSMGRKAAGAVLAVPAGIAGAAILGAHPDIPYTSAAKFGAKSMYNEVTKDKEGADAALKEIEADVKRSQSHERKKNTGERTTAAGDNYKKGGMTASSRGDGIAVKGKTRGTMVACGGGYMKGKK